MQCEIINIKKAFFINVKKTQFKYHKLRTFGNAFLLQYGFVSKVGILDLKLHHGLRSWFLCKGYTG